MQFIDGSVTITKQIAGNFGTKPSTKKKNKNALQNVYSICRYKHFLIDVEVYQTSTVTRVPLSNAFYRENYCIQ